MKSLEQKVRETIKEGTLVSSGMQPLAKSMLSHLKVKPGVSVKHALIG